MAAEAIGTQGDQEKEDFALSPVPPSARLPWPRIVNVMLGIAGAMIFMQVSGQMALQFGAPNAILANIYATVATALLGIVFAYTAAKTGLNSNLLARGCGYGFVGAALTSVIYASNFIILAAIEGSIIVRAIHAYVPQFPEVTLIVVITAANILLNWYGMKQLDWFQKYSLPVYVVLLVTAIVFARNLVPNPPQNWLTIMPQGGQVGGIALLTCMGILNGIVGVQSVLTADYARFIKRDELRIGAFAVGFTPQLASYFIMGLVGIWFATRFAESNPGVYMVVLGVWGAVYTALSQMRINVINLYSGSLSLSNFFARVFGFAPGRVFWVIVAAAISMIAMLSGVLDHVGPVLTFQGVFMFAWAASMIADLLVARRFLGMSSTDVEYRQERLRAWNPIGPIALVSGSLIGGYLALASTDPVLVAGSAFIAGLISFCVHIAVAAITGGKYYLAPEVAQAS